MADASTSSGLVEGPATLAIEGQLVQGTVLAADADLGFFLFVLAETEPAGEVLPEAGVQARIRWKGGHGYGAEANIVEIEDADRWVLSVPVGLDPSRQRQVTRLLAEGAWSFLVEDGARVEVYDVTERGLGLAYLRGEGPAGRGTEVSGTLTNDQGAEWSVVLLCTNVRAHPNDDDRWIVGGRLSHDNDEAKNRLRMLVEAML